MLGQTTTVEVDDRRRGVARVVLWVALVASVLIALWGTPRSASQDDFARALKAGDVRALQTSDGRYGLEWTALSVSVDLRSASTPPVVVWEDGRGMLHRTDLFWLRSTDPGTTGDTVDVAATMRATTTAAGVPMPTIDLGIGRAEYAGVPLFVMTVGFLGLLLFGPQPRRLTKWATFWVLWIPLGLGLAWWLARDAPFAPAMNRTVQPYPAEKGLLPNGIRRAGGGVAFLAAWGVSILVGIAAAVLIGVTGTTNASSDPVEPWSPVVVQQPTYGP